MISKKEELELHDHILWIKFHIKMCNSIAQKLYNQVQKPATFRIHLLVSEQVGR